VSGDSPSAVLIVPFTGGAPPSYVARRTSLAGWGRLRHLELALPNGATDLITWTKDLSSPVEYGSPVVSDAPLVWLRLDASGKPSKCFLLDGSYLELQARRLYDAARRETKLLSLA